MPTSLTDWVLQSRSAGYSPETIDAAFKAKHGFGVLDADPLSPAEAPTLRQDARNRLEAGTGPINPLRSAPAPIPASVDPAIQGATEADLYNHKSRNVIANRVGGGLMAIPASLTGVVKSMPVINPLAAIGGGSPWVNPQAAQGMADAFRAPAQTIAERQGLSPVYEGVQGQVQQTLGSNPAPDVKNDLGAGLSNFETAKAGIHDVWGGVKQLMGQPFGGSIPAQMLEQDPGVQTTQDMWNAQADSMAGVVHGATAGMAGIGANLVTQPAATIGNMPVELASVLAAERMAIAKGAKAVGAEYGTRPGIAGQVARGVGAAGEMADRPLDFATGLADRAKAKLPSSLTKLNLAMYLDDLVTAGRMQADKAAKLLEKHSPAEFRTYAETPVEQTPTLLQRAVKTAWNAAKGAAIGGEVIGDVPAAILGAAAPEAVRAAFAKLPAETRARLARQFTGSAGQQATPQETAMGEDVVDIGREAHGIEEVGREPAGIVATQDVRLLRPDPSDADAVRKNTVPRPGVTTRPLEVVDGDLVQSPNAGARFMDVAETAKDPRAVELAAKQAAEEAPSIYRDLDNKFKDHLTQLRATRSAAWERLKEHVNELRELNKERKGERDAAFDAYRDTQGEISKGFQDEKARRSQAAQAHQEAVQGAFRDADPAIATAEKAARTAAYERTTVGLPALEKARALINERAKSRVGSALDAQQQKAADVATLFDAMMTDMEARHSDERQGLRDMETDEVSQGITRANRDARLKAIAADQAREAIALLVMKRRTLADMPRGADMAATVPEAFAEYADKLTSTEEGLKSAREVLTQERTDREAQRRALVTGGPVLPEEAESWRKVFESHDQKLQDAHTMTQLVREERGAKVAGLKAEHAQRKEGFAQEREALSEASKSAKRDLNELIGGIDSEMGPRFRDAEDRKSVTDSELVSSGARLETEKFKRGEMRKEGASEKEALGNVQKIAKSQMREDGTITDKSMLEKSGLQRTAEPDRVPFTTDNATILAHTFEVERMTNKRGGTVPFEQVARLTTDPLLEDSESILRSKRFRGLLLDRAEAMLPGGKRLLDDYLNENVTPTSLGPTPESVTADLGGKRFNLRAEAAKLIAELESKPEGQEILRAARAEAIRANFKTARKLYAEQAIGDTLNTEADRFHTTETRGRENSMGDYVDNVARRSIKDTEALPQVTQYDPRQMSAALRGKYGKQADAAAKTLDNQYVPMPANIRKVMNDQRVAAGNEALHGPMWVKKGYLETVRAVAEAHNVLKEFSDFDQKITRGFFHAKKALTALSHGVHLTNMVGNGAFRWMQDGTDPVAQVADYRRVYQDWKHFNEGGDMTPADRRMMRSFAKAGGVETSQLDLDMDAMGMQKSPAQGKASQAWQKYEHAMTKAYSLGDALFKLSQGEKGYKYTMAALGKLGAGESVTLELGRGRAVKVVNEGAGKYRVGKTQLRLDSPELADLVAKHALEKPTRWLVDYSNVPIKMQAARTNILPQALGSVQPFMTWQYTMTDLPGKGGAVKHLLGYDGSMLHTDSPKLLREQAAAAALLGVKRASMIAAATQTGSDARRLASDANAGSKFNPDGANAAERTADPSKLKTWYLDPGNPFGPTEAAWSTLMQFAVDKAGGRPMTQQVDAGKPLKDYGDLTSREKREVQMKIRAEGAQYAAPMDMFNAKTSGAMFGVMKRWADGEKFSLTGAANDAAKLVVGDTIVSLADLAENAAAAVYDPTMVVGSRKTSGTNYADADIEDFAHFFLRRVISNASQDLDPLKRTQESLKAIRKMFDEEVVKPAEMAAGRARKYGTAAQHDERMDKWIRAITVVNGYLAAYGIPEIERAAATIQDDATNLPDSGDEP